MAKEIKHITLLILFPLVLGGQSLLAQPSSTFLLQRINSIVHTIRDYFNEVLEVDIGWGVLQTRRISNIGYGINNSCYLFLAEHGAIGTSKCGFIPLKNQFGFIFLNRACNSEAEIHHNIAHERGHGSFSLYHTFSNEDQYPRSKGSSDILIDYSNGSELDKYQWNLIHNPQNMIGVLLVAEEGALVYILELLEKIRVADLDEKRVIEINQDKRPSSLYIDVLIGVHELEYFEKELPYDLSLKYIFKNNVKASKYFFEIYSDEDNSITNSGLKNYIIRPIDYFSLNSKFMVSYFRSSIIEPTGCFLSLIDYSSINSDKHQILHPN